MNSIDFALLRFCLEHNDSPNLQETKIERDPKDYEWLKNVFNSLPSVAKQIAKCMDTIANDTDESNKILALEELLDMVDDIDIANDLAKAGLGEIAKAMVYQLGQNHENAIKIREQACWVMSTLAQNNPYCQNELLKQGVLPIVAQLYQSETHPKVQQKILSIVSAMARDFPEGLGFFAKEENKEKLCAKLLEHVNSPEAQLQVKAIVVIKHLCSSPLIKKSLIDQGAIELLCQLASGNASDESLVEMINGTLEALRSQGDVLLLCN